MTRRMGTLQYRRCRPTAGPRRRSPVDTAWQRGNLQLSSSKEFPRYSSRTARAGESGWTARAGGSGPELAFEGGFGVLQRAAVRTG